MLKMKNVVLGISGGVDSAVAALLLKNKGYKIQCVFMQNWDIADEKGICSADQDFKDASIICNKLNIPLKHVNFVKQYWNEVFLNLTKEYENGYTPNPDILCNRNIKFNYFYKYARDVLNADAIATGHYARSSFGSYLENYEADTDVKLLTAKDTIKDQTFFLSQIKQEALRRTMFPLGELTKPQVKQMAMENGLKNIAIKKESMGICFIGSRNFQEFIKEYIDNKPGHFVDIDTGKIVGKHNGLHQWTVGQRSRIPAVPHAYFISKKDVDTNTIFVAMGTHHPSLLSTLFFTSKPHWIEKQPIELRNKEVFDCQFIFQNTENFENCKVFETKIGLIIKLDKPKRALTKGQYAVFYKHDVCLGSGKIVNTFTSHHDVLKNKDNYFLTNTSNITVNIKENNINYTENNKLSVKLKMN